MKIKLVSDGTPGGTDVVNAETGEHIEGVRRAGWSVDGSGLPIITLVLHNSPVELVGDVSTIVIDNRANPIDAWLVP